jgi:hypothetical protein
MFNLELLMFHCVVWIGYSFLTDFKLGTVDVPLCGVDSVFLQKGIPYSHHTMEHKQV